MKALLFATAAVLLAAGPSLAQSRRPPNCGWQGRSPVAPGGCTSWMRSRRGERDIPLILISDFPGAPIRVIPLWEEGGGGGPFENPLAR
jgi:hypothetical protein